MQQYRYLYPNFASRGIFLKMRVAGAPYNFFLCQPLVHTCMANTWVVVLMEKTCSAVRSTDKCFIDTSARFLLYWLIRVKNPTFFFFFPFFWLKYVYIKIVSLWIIKCQIRNTKFSHALHIIYAYTFCARGY